MKSTVVQCQEDDALRKINFLFRRKKYKLISEELDPEAGVFEYKIRHTSWFFADSFIFRLNRLSDSNIRIEFSHNGGLNFGQHDATHQKELRMMESVYKMF